MIPWSFHPEAELEFGEAVDYYESRSEGLGLDFALEVNATIQRMREYPTAWPPLEMDVRRCQTRRFPFGVLYSVKDGSVLILAVMHLRRKPGYWRNRL